MGTETRAAAYVRGSGTRRLVFAREVGPDDADADGVAVAAGAIALGGGAIAGVHGPAALLAHGALAAQPEHKVDGAAPPLLTPPTGCSDTLPVPADWALVPPGLGAGDRFRLLFVTSTERHARSDSIGTYNRFVRERAAAGHAAIRPYAGGFRVVGSTSSVDARDNTCMRGTGVRVHWLNGAKVADDSNDFYDGTWDDRTHPRFEDGSAAPGTLLVYTGSWTSGSRHQSNPLGAGNGNARFGRVGADQAGSPMNAGHRGSANTGRFYGLSPVFRVVERIAVVSDGICARTAAVRAALLARVQANDASVATCAQVTDAHLAALAGTLDLAGEGLAVLAPGDFAGLGGIAALDLSGNALAGLLPGTFAGLDATLTGLDLSDNALSFLPARVFEHLTGLTALDLAGNPGSDGFAPDAAAGPAGGLDAVSGATVRLGLDGAEAGGEDPWGTNVARAWTRPSGTGGTLADTNTARASFAAPVTGDAQAPVFRLAVTGRGGDFTATDDVTVRVAAGPRIERVRFATRPASGGGPRTWRGRASRWRSASTGRSRWTPQAGRPRSA